MTEWGHNKYFIRVKFAAKLAAIVLAVLLAAEIWALTLVLLGPDWVILLSLGVFVLYGLLMTGVETLRARKNGARPRSSDDV